MHSSVKFSRVFSMPNSCTFSIPPIRSFVEKYIESGNVIVDPFARDCEIGTTTNDLNPNTKAQHHMKANEFLEMLVDEGVRADVILYDPPYSPRQISECYKASGLQASMSDTQNARLKKSCVSQITQLLKPDGYVLSFGWNSMGMGKAFNHVEVLLVFHGGAHNDTICVAQKKPSSLFSNQSTNALHEG